MNVKIFIVTAGLVARLSVQTAVAGTIQDVQTASDKADHATALEPIRLLAEKGNADAQYYLGARYSSGQGVSLDHVEAAKWYRLAANQGLAQAQSDLGDLYKSGLGLPQDFTEAAKWYRLAAIQGDAYAQYLLGFMYRSGYGVPQDLVQAHQWVNLADMNGYFAAKGLRDVVSKEMTSVQIAEAQRLAREWLAAHPQKWVSGCIGD